MPKQLYATLLVLFCGVFCSASAAFAAEAEPASRYPVFFVTCRQAEKKHGELYFGNDRAGELSFGEYIFEEKADDGENNDPADLSSYKMKLIQSEHQFLNALKANGNEKLAVFVHGFRKSFEGSMDCGVKIAEHLDRPLVVFAWPSRNSYFAYIKDECTAEWSSYKLSRLLGDLGEHMGYKNMVIVSHSLGARIVHWALRDLYSERPADKFKAALFFSPDVDQDTFLQNSAFLKRACSACHVFLGSKDTRIRISKFLHGSPRVGVPEKFQDRNSQDSAQFSFENCVQNHQIPFDLLSSCVQQYQKSDPAE